jgi:hypothetical protein
MNYVINRLLYLWNYSFYTELIFLVFDSFAIFLIYHSPFTRERKLFLLYTVAAFLLFITTDVLYFTFGPERFVAWEIINIIFSFIELTIFLFYYRQILKIDWFNKLIDNLRFYLIPSFILMTVMLVSSDRIEAFNLTGYFTVSLYFLLLIPPILYFYKTLRENSELEKTIALLSIWLFTYCIITIVPTILEGRFLGTPYKLIYRMVIAIHYIALTVLCFLLVVICKRNQNEYWTDKIKI